MHSFLHNYFPYADGGAPAPVDDPPRKSWANLNAIVRQWAPDPRTPGQFPYDQQRRELPPSITAVLVNDPPIKIAAATLALISAIWATPAPASPQQKRPSIVPSLVAAVVEQTPYASEVSLSAILQHWRVDTAPRQARKLPPQLLSVDNPPPRHGDYLWSSAPMWTVQPPHQIVALIPATAAVDDPPFSEPRQVPQPPAAWWPPQSAPRTPIAQAATADDPPFGYREPHWLTAPPAWWAAQSAPRTQPVSVDNPPPRDGRAETAVALLWPQPAWPSQALKLSPQLIAVAEDNPPFGVHAVPPPVWYAQAPQPVVRIAYVAQEAVAASDFVPFTRQAVWRASVDWSSQRKQLAPQLIAVPEDNPPFGLKRQTTSAPIGWDARVSAKIAAIIAVAAADNPPFGRRASIWTAQVSWPAQSAPRAVIPSTDDPPFGARRQRYGDATQPWPAQARRFTPAQADTPPPTEPRAFWTIIDAWRPAPPQPPVTKRLNPTALAVAVDDPPFASRRLREVPAYWLPPPTLWRQVKQAGVLRGTFFVGEPSAAWVAPAHGKWGAPIAARTWAAPARESAWRAIGGRVWKAFNREGWRR